MKSRNFHCHDGVTKRISLTPRDHVGERLPTEHQHTELTIKNKVVFCFANEAKVIYISRLM